MDEVTFYVIIIIHYCYRDERKIWVEYKNGTRDQDNL